MTTRRRLLSSFALGSAAALTLSVAVPAVAQDAPRVETEVTLNGNGQLEVVHVLQLSAAQRLLYKAGVIEKNDMTGLRARAKAALYSSERFELIADDKPIPLNILGAEVQGGHLYIYQTGSLSSAPQIWSAKNSILRDLSPRFDNVVNVPTSDGIRTIVFSGSDIDSTETHN